MAEKQQLSSRVSSMKFMQRREEAKNRKRLEQARDKKLKDAQWVVGTGTDTNIVADEAVVAQPIKFTPGRRSFGNFNPVVEKLVKQVEDDLYNDEIDEDAVGDKEMAATYSTYRGLRGKKAEGKDRGRGKGANHKGQSTGGSTKPENKKALRARAVDFLKKIAGSKKSKQQKNNNDNNNSNNNSSNDGRSSKKRKASSSPAAAPKKQKKRGFLKPKNPTI